MEAAHGCWAFAEPHYSFLLYLLIMQGSLLKLSNNISTFLALIGDVLKMNWIAFLYALFGNFKNVLERSVFKDFF